MYALKGAGKLTVWADYNDSLSNRFGRLWKASKSCDMVIKCRRRIFQVHGFVLCTMSSYFDKEISSNRFVNDTLYIDCDPDCMNTCLEYLYTGCVEVSEDQREAVASLAELLDIPRLYSMCKVADADNFLDMWKFGEAVGDKELSIKGKDATLANANDLAERKSFMENSFCRVVQVLSRKNMSMVSAGDSLRAALAWVGHDTGKRSSYLVPLLKTLCHTKISRVSLQQALHHPLVENQPEASGMLRALIKCSSQKMIEKPYLGSSKIPCHISIGRLNHDAFPDNDSAVMVKPLRFMSRWHALANLPSTLPINYAASVACCAVGKSLYVTGLGTHNNESWNFDMDAMHWKQNGDLRNRRESHCMIECGGTVYVLAGRVPDESGELVQQVEALDVAKGTWRPAGSLDDGWLCANAACCLYGDVVWIYGTLSRRSRLVQVYFPHTEESICIGSFRCGGHRGTCGIVGVEGKIIMADPHGLYMCSALQADWCNVTERSLYNLPFTGRSVLYPSVDNKFIISTGSFARDGSDNHEYQARVADVISNTGPGWQPVDNEWSMGKRQLVSGAHCIASIGVDALSQSSLDV